jgi:hypothetical protein
MATIIEFLEARMAEDEEQAKQLLRDLEGEIAESYAGAVDDKGPFTPQRLLSAKMWAQFAGQSKWRNFAEGQSIAYLASPERVLAECAAKRAILAHAISLGDDGVYTADYMPSREGEKLSGEIGTRSIYPGHPSFPQTVIYSRTLRALAAVSADHPDYQQEWAL